MWKYNYSIRFFLNFDPEWTYKKFTGREPRFKQDRKSENRYLKKSVEME